ncbi:MAG: 4-hydroxy-tetrahydrodipicolinate synthase [Bacteroidales bacterium]|nr:4-hydroxy-tetrahydrodipicolinate synthase [Bacteroidales bacterium]
MNKFSGTGVAIVTPFRTDSSIDFKSLENLIENLISNGIDYLVVLGTTGESVTLSKAEKKAVVNHVIEINSGRIPIVVGVGGNNTGEIIAQIKKNDFVGVDAILSVAPYYNKPTQKGLILHFEMIAATSPVPVILYNIPGRTGVNMMAETVIELAHKSKNIIAIKEASGDLDQITKIMKNKPEGFQVISGDDSLTIPIIAEGGVGVVSVLANAFPAEVSKLVSSALKGNFKEACNIHFKFTELIDLLFIDGNPAGVKAILHQMKFISNSLRLPLTPVEKETYDKISKLILQNLN